MGNVRAQRAGRVSSVSKNAPRTVQAQFAADMAHASSRMRKQSARASMAGAARTAPSHAQEMSAEPSATTKAGVQWTQRPRSQNARARKATVVALARSRALGCSRQVHHVQGMAIASLIWRRRQHAANARRRTWAPLVSGGAQWTFTAISSVVVTTAAHASRMRRNCEMRVCRTEGGVFSKETEQCTCPQGEVCCTQETRRLAKMMTVMLEKEKSHQKLKLGSPKGQVTKKITKA